MRRNNLIMLAVLIVLYFGLTWLMGSIYGPSYASLTGEDNWIPDGNGGWVEHGHPAGPAPTETSVNVPIFMLYLPFLIPGFILAVFLLTPLRVVLDGKPQPKETETEDTEPIPPEEPEDDSR